MSRLSAAVIFILVFSLVATGFTYFITKKDEANCNGPNGILSGAQFAPRVENTRGFPASYLQQRVVYASGSASCASAWHYKNIFSVGGFVIDLIIWSLAGYIIYGLLPRRFHA